MTHRLMKQIVTDSISLEISEDIKRVVIFNKKGKLVEFNIVEAWDMLRDAIATVDVSPETNPSLFRRKGEATAAISWTNGVIIQGEN